MRQRRADVARLRYLSQVLLSLSPVHGMKVTDRLARLDREQDRLLDRVWEREWKIERKIELVEQRIRDLSEKNEEYELFDDIQAIDR